jgi:hypothetical protein
MDWPESLDMAMLLAICLTVIGLDDRPCVIVVVGAPGTSDYASQFRKWADQWQDAAKKGAATSIRIGLSEESSGTDRDRLKTALLENASGKEPLWLVLIGHGTFDGREAKFNLRGPDVSDKELADWLSPVKRPIAVIHCGSSSGTFINKLSGENRVIVTATRAGDEQNYARFGQYLAESIVDPRADLDKDGQVSLLEAYLTAAGKVAEYYKTHAQLATEHALLDDNGDKLGTPPDWFQGVRATRRARDGAALDGPRAHQFHLLPSDRERNLPVEIRRRRDAIELQIAALRSEKEKLKPDEYYAKLEPLMVELARIYRELPARPR